MIENGFSSPRSDAFPAGLRVLVVDDDPTWLKILEKMLKKCSYEVTTCCLAIDALSLLRKRKDGYDIVISDVNMPDMDGFKLLEHVGLEMDLPVIMMSVDGETSRVMKGVQHGACDYLLKPIRMKELRNIWQHVLRKKIHEVRDIESYEGIEVLQLMRHGSDQSEDSLFLGGEDFSSAKKRKDVDGKHDEFGDSSSSKKPRVVWTVELHQKFVEAVNEIGFEKVGPKRILDSMGVPWLTRENVASHLQKYRLYLSRLQKENDLKVSFCGTKHSDLLSKDTAGKFSIQNSSNPHQNDAIFSFSGNELLVQTADAKGQEGDSEGIALMPVIESKRTLPGDVQLKQEREPLIQLKDSFTSGPPIQGTNTVDQVEHKPLYDEFRNSHVDYKTNQANHQAFETVSPRTSGTKNESCNVNCIEDSEDTPRNLALKSFNEDLQFSWLQGDDYAKNLALQNIEFSEENDTGLFGEAPLHLYDALRFDYEYAWGPIIF